MELILGVKRLISIVDGAVSETKSKPAEIIGGIGGRMEALLCKAHCGYGSQEIVGGGGITVRREVRHSHVVVAVHNCWKYGNNRERTSKATAENGRRE